MRRVVVTGSSRGIGAAISQRLIQNGHFVWGVARNPGNKDELYEPIALDLERLDGIADALSSCDADALICNAGQPLFGHLENLSLGDIQRSIHINLLSHIAVVHALLPVFKQRNHSNVIFIGSESALQGGPQGSIYSAAKFGLRGFAQALRKEAANAGVHVSVIHPGMVRTPWFDDLHFRPGDEDDQALDATDVADTVAMVLQARPGAVIDEITLSPQKHVIRFAKK